MPHSTKLAALLGLIALSLIGPGFRPIPASAHGVGYRESDIKPISLEFAYSTGETMSYLETQVFAPNDAQFAFQTGRTDGDGRFAFTPNVPGEWRVIVKDDEGHRAEAEINVTQEFLDSGGEGASGSSGVMPHTAAPEGMELFFKAAFGVSLIINIAAVTSFVRRKKRTA